jgi:hypothetical protein
LYKKPGTKRKLFDIETTDDPDLEVPMRKKHKGGKQKRRRPNPRNRLIWDLHEKMKKLVKE